MTALPESQERAAPQASGVVLIVDDDEAIRVVLKLAVEMSHRRTVVSRDGEQALSWLRQNASPCLILLDLMMPIMNGWQLLEALRTDERLARVPVVVTTAFEQDLGSAAALPTLRKPIELTRLLETIRQYCPGSAG